MEGTNEVAAVREALDAGRLTVPDPETGFHHGMYATCPNNGEHAQVRRVERGPSSGSRSAAPAATRSSTRPPSRCTFGSDQTPCGSRVRKIAAGVAHPAKTCLTHVCGQAQAWHA